MASKINTVCRLFTIVMLHIYLLPATATNFDCGGKPFYCVNSTYFMICVDLGAGITKTVDDFVIQCPSRTTCHKSNNLECEYHMPTTTELININRPAEETADSTLTVKTWSAITNTDFPQDKITTSLKENNTINLSIYTDYVTDNNTSQQNVFFYKLEKNNTKNKASIRNDYFDYLTTISETQTNGNISDNKILNITNSYRTSEPFEGEQLYQDASILPFSTTPENVIRKTPLISDIISEANETNILVETTLDNKSLSTISLNPILYSTSSETESKNVISLTTQRVNTTDLVKEVTNSDDNGVFLNIENRTLPLDLDRQLTKGTEIITSLHFESNTSQAPTGKPERGMITPKLLVNKTNISVANNYNTEFSTIDLITTDITTIDTTSDTTTTDNTYTDTTTTDSKTTYSINTDTTTTDTKTTDSINTETIIRGTTDDVINVLDKKETSVSTNTSNYNDKSLFQYGKQTEMSFEVSFTSTMHSSASNFENDATTTSTFDYQLPFETVSTSSELFLRDKMVEETVTKSTLPPSNVNNIKQITTDTTGSLEEMHTTVNNNYDYFVTTESPEYRSTFESDVLDKTMQYNREITIPTVEEYTLNVTTPEDFHITNEDTHTLRIINTTSTQYDYIATESPIAVLDKAVTSTEYETTIIETKASYIRATNELNKNELPFVHLVNPTGVTPELEPTSNLFNSSRLGSSISDAENAATAKTVNKMELVYDKDNFINEITTTIEFLAQGDNMLTVFPSTGYSTVTEKSKEENQEKKSLSTKNGLQSMEQVQQNKEISTTSSQDLVTLKVNVSGEITTQNSYLNLQSVANTKETIGENVKKIPKDLNEREIFLVQYDKEMKLLPEQAATSNTFNTIALDNSFSNTEKPATMEMPLISVYDISDLPYGTTTADVMNTSVIAPADIYSKNPKLNKSELKISKNNITNPFPLPTLTVTTANLEHMISTNEHVGDSIVIQEEFNEKDFFLLEHGTSFSQGEGSTSKTINSIALENNVTDIEISATTVIKTTAKLPQAENTLQIIPSTISENTNYNSFSNIKSSTTESMLNLTGPVQTMKVSSQFTDGQRASEVIIPVEISKNNSSTYYGTESFVTSNYFISLTSPMPSAVSTTENLTNDKDAQQDYTVTEKYSNHKEMFFLHYGNTSIKPSNEETSTNNHATNQPGHYTNQIITELNIDGMNSHVTEVTAENKLSLHNVVRVALQNEPTATPNFEEARYPPIVESTTSTPINTPTLTSNMYGIVSPHSPDTIAAISKKQNSFVPIYSNDNNTITKLQEMKSVRFQNIFNSSNIIDLYDMSRNDVNNSLKAKSFHDNNKVSGIQRQFININQPTNFTNSLKGTPISSTIVQSTGREAYVRNETVEGKNKIIQMLNNTDNKVHVGETVYINNVSTVPVFDGSSILLRTIKNSNLTKNDNLSNNSLNKHNEEGISNKRSVLVNTAATAFDNSFTTVNYIETTPVLGKMAIKHDTQHLTVTPVNINYEATSNSPKSIGTMESKNIEYNRTTIMNMKTANFSLNNLKKSNDQPDIMKRTYKNETMFDIPLTTTIKPFVTEIIIAKTTSAATILRNRTSVDVKANKRLSNIALFTCKNFFRGRYPDKDNCRRFYICIGKDQPIYGECPSNTVFSNIKKQCTKNLSHCIRNNQFQCIKEGRFSDVLRSNIYYICVKNKNRYVRFQFRCLNGYHLNKASIRCVAIEQYQSQVISTSIDNDSKKGSDQSTVEKKPKENKKEKDVKKNICTDEGKFADVDDCRKYYVCSKNSKSVFRRRTKKCDSDEVFHREKKKCVDSESYECK